ncbi:MAG: sensor histidine kinase [Gammaproteobacteria bacterium]|nr:sensor histidine kinase [Gammaproteobacteria bacterium]
MYSLKKKIARNLTLNLLFVMIGLLLAMYLFAQQLLHDYILTHLQHDAESLASVIYKDRAQGWKIDSGRMSTVYSRVRSGHYYYVRVDRQVIVSRSLFDADFPGVDANRPSGSDFMADGPGDERWIIWHQTVTKNGESIGIWIAEDIAPFRNQLLRYSAAIVGLIVVFAALLFYLQQRTLRQAFEVFDWLRLNLAEIKHRKTDRSGLPMPLEIAPLVTEIEKLVEHLSHRIVRTRNAMGNLAHELKRPLQLLSIQLENERGGAMRDALGEIRNILERELRRARISGSSAGGGEFNIAQELDYLADMLRKIYPDIEIEIELEGRVETPGMDRDDMLELIGNLFDNACKFARSRARFGLSSVEGRFELVFEDDGPGLDHGQLQQLNRRGQRLDESVAGHGLGLGICRDILDYYHGSLSFSASGLGGLCVVVKIPMI